MEDLIFDRTLSDITNDTSKGQYNASDLNRIELWTQYIYNELATYNYATKELTFKTNWLRTDFPTEAQMSRILSNIQYIKDVYDYVAVAMPSTLKMMTYTKANTIEKLLYYTHEYIKGMEKRFVHCGVSNMGQARTWQNRWRKAVPIYTELSWIQNADINQYIDTGVLINDNVEVEFKFQVAQLIDVGWNPIAGTFTRSPSNRYYPIQLISATSTQWGTASSSNDWLQFGTFDYDAHIVKYNSGTSKSIIFDDTTVGTTKTFNSVTVGNVYIYGKDNVETSSHSRIGLSSQVKFYYFKIINRSTQEVLHNLIPIKLLNNEICMFDTITNTTYENQGTGEFLGG